MLVILLVGSVCMECSGSVGWKTVGGEEGRKPVKRTV